MLLNEQLHLCKKCLNDMQRKYSGVTMFDCGMHAFKILCHESKDNKFVRIFTGVWQVCLRFNFWLESRKELHWQMAHMQFALIPGADFSLKSSAHSSRFQHKADKKDFLLQPCLALTSDSVVESPECRFECKLHTLRSA